MLLLIKIKNKITIRAQHYTKQSVWNRKNHAKYDTKSTEESKKSQSTGHTDSSDSINRITQQKYKNKKLSHSDATTAEDHQHHLEAEIVILREIHRTTITIRKTITVVDVVEQRDMKL